MSMYLSISEQNCVYAQLLNVSLSYGHVLYLGLEMICLLSNDEDFEDCCEESVSTNMADTFLYA